MEESSSPPLPFIYWRPWQDFEPATSRNTDRLRACLNEPSFAELKPGFKRDSRMGLGPNIVGSSINSATGMSHLHEKSLLCASQCDHCPLLFNFLAHTVPYVRTHVAAVAGRTMYNARIESRCKKGFEALPGPFFRPTQRRPYKHNAFNTTLSGTSLHYDSSRSWTHVVHR